MVARAYVGRPINDSFKFKATTDVLIVVQATFARCKYARARVHWLAFVAAQFKSKQIQVHAEKSHVTKPSIVCEKIDAQCNKSRLQTLESWLGWLGYF